MSKPEKIDVGYAPKINMPPRLEDLPADLQAIAATGQAYVDEDGMRPVAGSCKPFIYGPLAYKMSPMTANARINKYAAANPDCGFYTYREFFDFYKIGTASKEGRPKITARNIFNSAVLHLKTGGSAEVLKEPDRIFSGYKISVLDRAFQKANLPDLADFVPPNRTTPQSVFEFVEITGLITSPAVKLNPRMN